MVKDTTLLAYGISSQKKLILYLFIPVFLFNFLLIFFFVFFFELLLVKIFGIIVILLITFFVIFFPLINANGETKEINEQLPYFITYAGAVSTLKISRKKFFKLLSEKKQYPTISKQFKKILYLSKKIKLDFSESSYKVAQLNPSKTFSEFLERMGVSISFYSDSKSFFLDEQKSLMIGYKNFYKESLERIKIIQDIFSSLILSFAYILGIIFLLPFISGIDVVQFLQYSIIFLVFVDIIVIYLCKSTIVEDKLYVLLKDIEDIEFSKKLVGISFMLGIILFVLIEINFENLGFLMKVALSSIPFFFVGFYTNKKEEIIKSKDKLFIPFSKSLGEVHKAKGGTLNATLENLIPHNFGLINDDIKKLYKRVKISKDNKIPWSLFSKESASKLINEFFPILVIIANKDGNTKVAGEIISKNMSIIIGLREIRNETVKTFKSTIYSGFFGLSLTIFLCLEISKLLIKSFSDVSNFSENTTSQISGFFSVGTIDFQLIGILIGIFLIIHSFFASFLLKTLDGGNIYGLFKHFSLLLLLGAFVELGTGLIFVKIFSGLV